MPVMILHKSHTVPTTTLADIPLRPEKLPVTVSREFDAISPLICWRLILMIRPVWASNSMAAAWLFAIVSSCKIESPKWTRRRKINITSHLLMSSWPLEKKAATEDLQLNRDASIDGGIASDCPRTARRWARAPHRSWPSRRIYHSDRDVASASERSCSPGMQKFFC